MGFKFGVDCIHRRRHHIDLENQIFSKKLSPLSLFALADGNFFGRPIYVSCVQNDVI